MWENSAICTDTVKMHYHGQQKCAKNKKLVAKITSKLDARGGGKKMQSISMSFKILLLISQFQFNIKWLYFNNSQVIIY